MLTPRLPIPGADDGDWGTILNSFLSQSLNADGTLNAAALPAAGAQATSEKGQISGYAALNGAGIVPSAQLGAGIATSSSFLRGDGTWAIPNSGSSSLANNTDVSIAGPTNNQLLTFNSTSGKWINGPAGLTLDTTASDIQPLGTQAAGSTGKAADASHVHTMPRLDQVAVPVVAVNLNGQHITGLANGSLSSDAATFGQIPTVLPPNGTAGGDLVGNYPSPTVAATANVESIIRANRLDQFAVPTTAIAFGAQKITGLANGTAATDAAAFGQIPTTLPGSPTGTAGGDLTGTYPNPTIAPATANFKTQVRTVTLDTMATPLAPVALGAQKITGLANGSLSTDAAAFGQIPTVLPPSGTAGGDLSGSYPNPTLANTTTARTNLGLGSSATQPSTAFDAAGAASTVQGLAVLKANNLSDVNPTTARNNLGVPGKFAATYGDGSTLTYVIAHGLGTADVVAMVYTVSGGAAVDPDITVSATNVTLVHLTAPTANQYRVVVVG